MIESRKNGTFAITCDRTDCHMEVLGATEAEAIEDANLMGWTFQGDSHTCRDCCQGRNPAAIARFGTDVIEAGPSPQAYQKGEVVKHPATGEAIGYAADTVLPGADLFIIPATEAQIAERAAQAPQHRGPCGATWRD